MTIQRQYTLPNCNLILEGLTTDANDPASPMSVLMNVECHLPGATDATLTGGREFLDSLVLAVSQYAQQLLSGVPRPILAATNTPPIVDLKPGEGTYHHLIVRDQSQVEATTDTEATAPLDVKLSTVQFYDLMEAVDQLLADGLTLPDLKPQFQSVSRRQVKPTEPPAKRAVPAVIGAATLAAAGLAFFFIPPPEFEPSQPSTETDAPAETTNTGLTDTPATPPEGTTTEDDLTTTNPLADQSSTDAGTETDSATSETTADPAATVDRLASAPAITDPDTLGLLQSDLRRTLQDAWAADPRPEDDLAYRVTVAEDGDILGYKYQNDLALDEVNTTPLPDLLFVPPSDAAAIQESVAQFLVTFTPEGDISVEPLGGEASTEAGSTTTGSRSAPAELSPLDEPIADRTTLEALVRSLRGDIADELQPLSANQDLTYRVRVATDGEVIGYAPVDAESGLLAEETPLPDLVSNASTDEAQADFRVVFTESGVLEVSPWDGWPQ
jgi:hypothetical protein